MTHICVDKLTIIGSDNGLSPERHQAIIWTNAGILLIGPLGTNFSEILIEILTFWFKKMRLKVSSAKWRPFCLGLNVLTHWAQHKWSPSYRRHSHAFSSMNDIVLVFYAAQRRIRKWLATEQVRSHYDGIICGRKYASLGLNKLRQDLPIVWLHKFYEIKIQFSAIFCKVKNFNNNSLGTFITWLHGFDILLTKACFIIQCANIYSEILYVFLVSHITSRLGRKINPRE